MNHAAQSSVIEKFRTLHQSGCFILPNPWDVGTAVYLHHLGFEAVATTSAGFAFSRGKQDGAVPRDEMLAHIHEIVEATPLPVNVLVSGFNHHLSIGQLSDLGVRRISIGSGLALVAWNAFIRAARSLTSGSFKALAEAARSDELNKLFSQRG